MADDTGGFTVVSRPKTPLATDTGGFSVVSRPQAPGSGAPHSTPGFLQEPAAGAPPAPAGEPDSFTGRVAANWREGTHNAQEGMDRLLGRPASPWERVKGAGQALMGGAEQASSIPDAAIRTVGGKPTENLARDAGAPPWLAESLGHGADAALQIASGSVAKKVPGMIREIPKTADEIMTALRGAAPKVMPTINKGATKVGGVARSTVNAADDLVKQRGVNAARTAEEKAANAAPTKDTLKTAGGGEFQAAKEIGGDIKPEVVQGHIGGLRQRVIDDNVDLHAEDTYPTTRKMLDYLERRQEDVSSFSDLMSLQREANSYVRRARIAAVATGDKSDYRAAQIAMKDLDNFVANLKPGDMVGGDPEAANASLRQAKELWARGAKMDVVEDVVKKAERLKDPDYLKSEFRKIALDDYQYDRFTPAEQKLIDEIAADSRLGRASEALPSWAGKPRKLGEALMGTSTFRMGKAKELMDMIARGEGAQAETAANSRSFGQRINEMLEPPNSRSRARQ